MFFIRFTSVSTDAIFNCNALLACRPSNLCSYQHKNLNYSNSGSHPDTKHGRTDGGGGEQEWKGKQNGREGRVLPEGQIKAVVNSLAQEGQRWSPTRGLSIQQPLISLLLSVVTF